MFPESDGPSGPQRSRRLEAAAVWAQMPVSYLGGSRFSDYRTPGAIAVGCGLIIWIVVEVLIAVVTLLPSVRRFCAVAPGR